MDIYNLYRNFWNFAFENPQKIKPNHCAVFSFSVEHCNRLGWKRNFGLPTSMVMEAVGIKSYSVYKKTFDELIDFGFFEIIELSKNQYSSNIIALKENNKALNNANNKALDKANNKALDKAIIKHSTKQSESTVQSNDSINKPINNKPITNNIDERKLKFASTIKPYLDIYGKEMLNDFYKYWTEPNKSNTTFRQELEKTWSIERRIETWAKNDKSKNKKNTYEQVTEIGESIREINTNK